MLATFKVEARRKECGGILGSVHFTGAGRMSDFLRPYFDANNAPLDLLRPEAWGPDNRAEISFDSDTPLRMQDALRHFRSHVVESMQQLAGMMPFSFTLHMVPISGAQQ